MRPRVNFTHPLRAWREANGITPEAFCNLMAQQRVPGCKSPVETKPVYLKHVEQGYSIPSWDWAQAAELATYRKVSAETLRNFQRPDDAADGDAA